MAATERVYPGSPAPIAGGRLFPSPIQFLFTGEDGLRVTVVNVAADNKLSVTARWQNAGEDAVQALRWDFTPNIIGVDTVFDIPLPAGILLNLVVRSTFARVERGECFVRVDVVRGRGPLVVLGTLLSGYVGSSGGRAWPGTPLEDAVDGVGWVHRAPQSAPALGADAALGIPDNAKARVLSLMGTLITSAAAGTRTPYLQHLHNGLAVYYGQSSHTQAPSTTVTHVWTPGLQEAPGTNGIIGRGALPNPVYLKTRGATDSLFKLLCFPAMDAGDQWTGLVMMLEEWRNPTGFNET